MARKVFFSFHFEPDNWRASQVRRIGSIEGSREALDNDWEQIKRGGDAAIKRWIDGQMEGRSCTVVLVGSQTANRKWINYEIEQSWKRGMGVVGIKIHGLKDSSQRTSVAGANPFLYAHSDTISPLSRVIDCHDPVGFDSTSKYGWISTNISRLIEEAIRKRAAHR